MKLELAGPLVRWRAYRDVSTDGADGGRPGVCSADKP
jgi:hypothetical protein